MLDNVFKFVLQRNNFVWPRFFVHPAPHPFNSEPLLNYIPSSMYI